MLRRYRLKPPTNPNANYVVVDYVERAFINNAIDSETYLRLLDENGVLDQEFPKT
jgi:hypothetical protein